MSMLRAITIHQPSRLEIGENALVKASAWIKDKTTLIISSKAVSMHAQRLELSTQVHIFDETPAEPDEIALQRILEVAQQIKPQVIIGLGGGSVMDLAKLCAVLWDKEQTLMDVVGPNKVKRKLSLLIQIPTTAGTGSESGIRALVTDSKTSAKMAIESEHMRADVAILDPTLTYSVPAAITAATGIDAMAHCVEALTNNNAHEMIDDFARTGVKLVGQYLQRAVLNGNDTQAREGMMLASYYGGICLGPVNTAAGHALAYPLSTALKLPHGLANAIIFPHVLSFNSQVQTTKTAQVLTALGLSHNGSSESIFKAAYDFCSSLGIQMQLSEHGAQYDALPEMASQAHAIRRLMDNNPKAMSVEEVLNIYQAAF